MKRSTSSRLPLTPATYRTKRVLPTAVTTTELADDLVGGGALGGPGPAHRGRRGGAAAGDRAGAPRPPRTGRERRRPIATGHPSRPPWPALPCKNRCEWI